MLCREVEIAVLLQDTRELRGSLYTCKLCARKPASKAGRVTHHQCRR